MSTTVRNLANRKLYDMLEGLIMRLCELQSVVVASFSKINERDFYAMFVEELLGLGYTSLDDFVEKNKENFESLE
ncbi:MAG TPA: hypothetical protein VFD03_09775 [Clostridia bacterium]|nr:hypothetical protein [Clostridia bacterium]